MAALLTQPIVCLITPGHATSENYAENKIQVLDTIRRANDDGVSLIQIREKKLPDRFLLELAEAAVAIVSHTRAKVLINARADIATAAGAHGVHLPAYDLRPDVVRRITESDFVIGFSAHSVEEAATAKNQGADFVTFGPVFETPGKPRPKGLESLRQVCNELNGYPVIAIGGIDSTNCRPVLDAGAAGIAAIRSLNDWQERSLIIRLLRE